MKKILFLIPNLAHGGAEKVLVNLVNNLDPKKYDITVQTLFDTGVYRESLKPHIHYIGGASKQLRGYTHLQKLFSPAFLYRHIVRQEYDIAAAYLEGTVSRIISGCRSKKTKTVCWIHTELSTEKLFSRCFRNEKEAERSYGSLDKIITVSQQTAKPFFHRMKQKDRILTLYNTNETEQILERSRECPENKRFSDDGGVKVCSVGKLNDVKGFDRFLKVHKKLLDEGFPHRIYILGIGEKEEELRSTAKKLGVSDSFILLGFQENPYQYVSKCDLYVCSSRREGFSTAVTEALIVGTPVVSTDCSGAKELLGEHDEYGLVVENSTKGIYHGMKKMLSDPELLEHYREKAAERGRRFSRERTVKAVEDMLDSL